MKVKPNMDIRTRSAMYGICLWEVAAELGILDSALSRKMRKELPDEEKQKIFDAIDRIVARG